MPTIPNPEYHNFEEFQNRSQKLKELREIPSFAPYPHKFEPIATLGEVQKDFFENTDLGNSEDAGNGKTPPSKIAGRLVLFRAMGKNAFAQLQDETGRIQIMFNRDLTKVEGYEPKEGELSPLKFIEKKIDLGDLIGVEGHLFRTQKGELTLFVKTMTLLCKTLLPLPDKHSGLADKGVRYRKRWLDLISTPETLETFKLRSKILKITRNYLEDLGFMEVETPILQNIYGGAEARPFKTELNALHQEMFLRISLEIPLKKLIVGGFLKVFEMGKVFRNEGIDKTHNPEFTELEAYAAYWDYHDVMSCVENLYETIALDLFGDTKIPFPTKTSETIIIDVKAPWKRVTMIDSIKIYGGIDVDALSAKEMKDLLLKKGDLDPEGIKTATRGRLIAALFEEFAESHLIQPHHIIDHPIETTPLCKLHRDPKSRDKKLVERFESFILGGEICNAYTELNDPELQRELLLEQAEKKEAGDEEAHPLDEEFIEAICQGMPPTGGFGIGIDRMVMLFAKAITIKDVLFFPLMKPEDS